MTLWERLIARPHYQHGAPARSCSCLCLGQDVCGEQQRCWLVHAQSQRNVLVTGSLSLRSSADGVKKAAQVGAQVTSSSMAKKERLQYMGVGAAATGVRVVG